jgi:hypothetical protein
VAISLSSAPRTYVLDLERVDRPFQTGDGLSRSP